MTEALLPVTSPPAYYNQSVLLETSSYVPLAKVAVAKALAFRTVCRIINFSPHVVTLRKRERESSFLTAHQHIIGHSVP